MEERVKEKKIITMSRNSYLISKNNCIITSMYIETTSPEFVEGYEIEQKGILVFYKQKKKVEINKIEEFLK